MTELVAPGYRPVFPRPAREYNTNDQDNFRNSVQRALDYKLGRNEASVFGGIPMSLFKGSNATFSVPTGAGFTKLVSDSTALRSTDAINTLDLANSALTPSLTSDWEIVAKLKYVSGGGGALAKLNVAVFKAGVIYDSVRIPVQLDAAQTIEAKLTVLGAAPANAYDIRVSHSEAGSVVFDLTNSLWGFKRLSSMAGLQQ